MRRLIKRDKPFIIENLRNYYDLQYAFIVLSSEKQVRMKIYFIVFSLLWIYDTTIRIFGKGT